MGNKLLSTIKDAINKRVFVHLYECSYGYRYYSFDTIEKKNSGFNEFFANAINSLDFDYDIMLNLLDDQNPIVRINISKIILLELEDLFLEEFSDEEVDLKMSQIKNKIKEIICRNPNKTVRALVGFNYLDFFQDEISKDDIFKITEEALNNESESYYLTKLLSNYSQLRAESNLNKTRDNTEKKIKQLQPIIQKRIEKISEKDSISEIKHELNFFKEDIDAKISDIRSQFDNIKEFKEKIKVEKEKRIALEKELRIRAKDFTTLKEDIDTIPHMKIAYQGKDLEKKYQNLDNRLIKIETDFSELKNKFISKKKIRNIIWLIWSLSATVASLVLALLKLLKV